MRVLPSRLHWVWLHPLMAACLAAAAQAAPSGGSPNASPFRFLSGATIAVGWNSFDVSQGPADSSASCSSSGVDYTFSISTQIPDHPVFFSALYSVLTAKSATEDVNVRGVMGHDVLAPDLRKLGIAVAGERELGAGALGRLEAGYQWLRSDFTRHDFAYPWAPGLHGFTTEKHDLSGPSVRGTLVARLGSLRLGRLPLQARLEGEGLHLQKAAITSRDGPSYDTGGSGWESGAALEAAGASCSIALGWRYRRVTVDAAGAPDASAPARGKETINRNGVALTLRLGRP